MTMTTTIKNGKSSTIWISHGMGYCTIVDARIEADEEALRKELYNRESAEKAVDAAWEKNR